MKKTILLLTVMFIMNFNARALSVVELSYEDTKFKAFMYEKMQGLWIKNDFISFNSTEYIYEVRKCYYEGMNPKKYLPELPPEILEKVFFRDMFLKTGNLYNEEVLNNIMTDSFIKYTADLFLGVSYGRIKDKDNLIKRSKQSYYDEMKLLIGGSQIYFRPSEIIAKLKPETKMYYAMAKYYKKLERVEKNGNWEQVQSNARIPINTSAPAVTIIRRNLSKLYGKIPYSEEELYDTELMEYVKRFQKMAGISAIGFIGEATIREINKTPAERKKTLAVNMERLRLWHTHYPENYIMINIPLYEFNMYNKGENVMQMRVVVGKKERKTPILENNMHYMVINPTWTIPKTILEKDVIPARIKDVEYFQKNRIKIFTNNEDETIEVNHMNIDWTTTGNKLFRKFKFVQDSDEMNALGKVKFILTNKENIYLHDTTAKTLFQNTERAFSSGCVRLEKPVELAEYLIDNGKGKQKKWLNKIIAKKKDYYVGLPKPVKVYIYYLTAYLNGDNEIIFLKDVYEKDEEIYSVLSNDVVR